MTTQMTHPEPLLRPIRGGVWPRVRDHACRCCACSQRTIMYMQIHNLKSRRPAAVSGAVPPNTHICWKSAPHAHMQRSRIRLVQCSCALRCSVRHQVQGFGRTCILGIQAQGRQQRGVSVQRQPLRQERGPISDRHSHIMSGTVPHYLLSSVPAFDKVLRVSFPDTCRAQAFAFAVLAVQCQSRCSM